MPIISGGGSSSGGGSGLPVLFDTGVTTGTSATLDTGANGIAGGHAAIMIVIVAQSNSGSGAENWTATVNGSSGGNYESQSFYSIDAGGVNADVTLAASWTVGGGLGGTNTFATSQIWTCPGYAGTTFWKSFYAQQAAFVGGGSGGNRVGLAGYGWRQTAAITQFTLIPPSTKLFVAGSRLTVFGIG